MNAWDRFDNFLQRVIGVMLGILVIFLLLAVMAGIVIGGFSLLKDLS